MGIPRIKTNSKDIERLFGLFAALQELKETSQEMEKRFRLIPNGWRNLRLIISLFDKLMDDVMLTVPEEKLASMKRMRPRMRFKVVCGIQATSLERDECIISVHEADVLSHYAHEQCKLCFGDESCDRCELGKVLDSVMSYDRNGRSWAYVDLEEGENHD